MGRGDRDTLHSGSLRQASDGNVAEISMLPICIAKIRDGQFVTFSNAFASDSRVAGAIRDGGFPASPPPLFPLALVVTRLNLTYHCPMAWKRGIQVRNYTMGEMALRMIMGSCGTNAGNCQSLLVRGERRSERNSFIIERVSDAEVFDGISVFR